MKKKQYKKFPVCQNDVPDLPMEEYVCGILPCAITAYTDPCNFYVRLLSEELRTLYLEMVELMTKLYEPLTNNDNSNDKTHIQGFMLEVEHAFRMKEDPDTLKKFLDECYGEFGVVRVEKKFRRVMILKWYLEKKECGVFLIDLGKFVIVQVNQLLPLDPLITLYPRFAIRCQLDQLRPPYGQEKWPETSLCLFQNLIVKANVWMLFLLPFDLNSSITYSVSLVFPGQEDSMSDTLVKYKAADRICDEEEEFDRDWDIFLANSPYWDPQTAAYKSHRNQYNIDIDDPGVALFGYVGKDQAVICPFYARNGKCYKGDACRKEHIQVDPEKCTNIPQLLPVSTDELPKLLMGESYRIHSIVLSYLDSEYKKYGHLYVVLSDNVCEYRHEMSSMLKELNRTATIYRLDKLLVPPGLNELLLVCWRGEWHRGMCKHSYPDLDSYSILLLDTGTFIEANQADLRPMPHDFLHIPFLARPVVLKDYQISDDPKSSAVFEILLKEIALTGFIKVVDECETLIVDLVTEDGKNLAPLLEAKGIVKKIPGYPFCSVDDMVFG